MKRKKIGIVVIVIVAVAAAGLLGTTLSCENPIAEILARDLSNPDIVIRAGDTIIDPVEGLYIFTASEEGTIEDVTFTISNIGTGTLTLNPAPVDITGTDSAFFVALAQPELLTLEAGAETAFTVSFDAVDKRTYTAEVRVSSDDPEAGEYVFNLQATIGPKLQILRNGTEIDLNGGTDSLGTVYYEEQKSFIYTIKNVGTATLELTGTEPVAVSGTGMASVNYSQPSASIAPGGSDTFSLDINPANLGSLSAQVSIQSNDEDAGSASFTVPFEALLPLPEIGVTDMDCGNHHTVALKNNGTVWSWGRNSSGQLGDGNAGTDSDRPVQVAGVSGVVAVAGGREHSVVLKSDGTVWCWGINEYGQLGNGNEGTDSDTPVQVSNLSEVVAVAGGYDHSVALRNDGSVWCWGRNIYGQLGDGNDPTGSDTPVQVSAISDVVAVASGSNFSVALKSDGTVWSWGSNQYGQLGDGNMGISNDTPVQVLVLSDISAIGSGDGHAVALKSDGTVWCWGYNNEGQLGDGNLGTDSDTPVQVSGLTDVIAVAGGIRLTAALKNDGKVWCWGNNFGGGLGDGNSPTDSDIPVLVSSLTDVDAIAGGGLHSIASKSDGTVWSWGANSYGQLGDGNQGTDSDTPVQVFENSDVAAVSGGTMHSLALRNDGTVWSWGANSYGQLGDGNIGTNSAYPVQVSDISDVVDIAAGNWHNIALSSDGTVWSWGYNAYGQLGNASSGTDIDTPVQVTCLSNVIAIAAGRSHSIALKSDGSVWCWGWNSNGQLGHGSIGTDSSVPVQVSGLTDVTAVVGGGRHTLGVENNEVWCWGSNSSGQLGDGNLGIDRITPMVVSGQSDITAIAGGASHTFARKNDGTVYSWGSNGNGQLGDGNSPTDSDTPVQVSGLTNVTAVTGGGGHSMAVKSDGSVWCWGFNYNRQLGDGTTNDKHTPVETKFIFLLK